MKLGLRFFIPLVGISALSLATPASDMLTISGHARTRLEFADNRGGAEVDATEQWLNRVRLNLDLSPTKSLMVRVSPELAHTWGGGVPSAGQAAAGLSAREGWMSWQATDSLKIKAGRQVMSFGNGLVIGTNDDYQTTSIGTGVVQAPYYFDALRADWAFDLGSVALIYSRITETALVGTSDPADTDLYGAYVTLNPDMGAVKNADVYALWFDNRTGNGGGNRYGTFGVRADGEVAVLNYNVELTTNLGKTGANDDTLKGYTTEIDLSAAVMEDHKVGFEFVYANSENQTFAQDDGAHAGRLDIVARNNMMSFGLNSNWKLHEKWSAYLDGFYFLAAKDDLAVTVATTTAAPGKRSLGLEGNLGIAYQAEKNLTIDAGYALFKGMSALKPNDKVLNALSLTGTLVF